MARIVGVELQDSWKVDYALTRIKGIGWTLSKKILSLSGVEPSKRISDLTPDEVAKITSGVEKNPVEGELVRRVRANVSRLQVTGSYRGLRHSRNLPVRGQRTRSNARAKRGKRKTVGAFKKEQLAMHQKEEKVQEK